MSNKTWRVLTRIILSAVVVVWVGYGCCSMPLRRTWIRVPATRATDFATRSLRLPQSRIEYTKTWRIGTILHPPETYLIKINGSGYNITANSPLGFKRGSRVSNINNISVISATENLCRDRPFALRHLTTEEAIQSTVVFWRPLNGGHTMWYYPYLGVIVVRTSPF